MNPKYAIPKISVSRSYQSEHRRSVGEFGLREAIAPGHGDFECFHQALCLLNAH